jgi:hypothetical protein
VKVKTRIQRNVGVQVTFADLLELSLDCSICQRLRRTIMLTSGNETSAITPRMEVISLSLHDRPAICTPSLHTFPGQITDKTVDKTGLPTVTFNVRYDFVPFTEMKYGKTYLAQPEPTWARIHFSLLCPQCGTIRKKTTQTNLVRPWTTSCDCGYPLFTDDMPPEFADLELFNEYES